MKKLLLLLSITVFVQGAFGQWKKIAQFPAYITAVYFLAEEGAPLKGFVGSFDFSTQQPIFLTSDGGKSWAQTIASTPTSIAGGANNFSFKDSLNGWVAIYRDSSIGGWPTVFSTKDGGKNWQTLDYIWWPQQSIGAVNGPFEAVRYNKHTDLLIAGNDVYSNNGISFHTMIGPGGHHGCTFSNDTDGIIVTWQRHPYKRTTDGGFTWLSTGTMDQFHTYMPLAIKGTQTFFVAGYMEGDYGLQIYRTDDIGLSWRKTASIMNARSTHTIQGDLKNLFVLTANGVYRSIDEGITWRFICGPKNSFGDQPSTPLYVYGNNVYAVDITGGLWYLDASVLDPEPQFSSKKLNFISSDCRTIDQLLAIASQDPCGSETVEILEIQITGSPNFSFTGDQRPFTISVRDTIEVHYIPSSTPFDTANLYIKFRIGTQDREINIPLYGSAIPRETFSFNSSLSDNRIKATEITEYSITPSKSISGKNLSEITCDVTFDADLLEPRDFSTDILNAIITYTTSQQANGTITYHLKITGTDMSLERTTAIARISLLTYVTDTISTPITLSNVKLNGFDPDYERCTLAASSRDTTFTLALLCGDRTLTNFLRYGRNALAISSIHPNPAQDELNISIKAHLDELATVDIIDMTGQIVRSMTQTVSPAFNEFKFNTGGIPSGMYILEIQTTYGRASQKFTIER